MVITSVASRSRPGQSKNPNRPLKIGKLLIYCQLFFAVLSNQRSPKRASFEELPVLLLQPESVRFSFLSVCGPFKTCLSLIQLLKRASSLQLSEISLAHCCSKQLMPKPGILTQQPDSPL